MSRCSYCTMLIGKDELSKMKTESFSCKGYQKAAVREETE